MSTLKTLLGTVLGMGKSVVENPRRAPLELNYVGRCVNAQYFKLCGPPDGYDLMDEDWDTAIVLDACRYDVFAEECTLDGDLSKAIAPGSNSLEFIKRTFQGETFHDTVYVTGNPFTTALDDGTFHDVKLDEAWSDRSREAPPENITDAAIEAHREYPEKRILVHYMTPHRPFVAADFEHVNDEIGSSRGKGGGYFQDTTQEEFRAAYRANVRVALTHIEELLDEITGKVVVTADHGEGLAERVRPVPVRVVGHPPYCYVPELVEVPWLEIENGERRDVRAESPVGSIDVDEETRERRLRALGYVEGA